MQAPETAIKTYKCQDCPKEFRTRSARTCHVQSIHQAKRFICDTCQTTYTRHSILKKHITKKHDHPQPQDPVEEDQQQPGSPQQIEEEILEQPQPAGEEEARR